MPTPSPDTTPLSALDRFTRDEVLRMVGVTAREIGHWERLHLVEPHESPGKPGEKAYSFEDLISLRTIKQLTGQGVTAARVLEAVEAARRQLGDPTVSLAKLRIVPVAPTAPAAEPVGSRASNQPPNQSRGPARIGVRKLSVEYEGRTLELDSGQFVFKFDAGETRLRAMKGRTVEQWLRVAAQCEVNPRLRSQAIEAYLHVVEAVPDSVEAHINLGMLFYEQGEFEEAQERFKLAVTLAPDNALANFNLGTVLDELKQSGSACHYLREAVRLKPDYADAHYNLARVYEELGGYVEARPHWRRYLELDPDSSWAGYVRQRLGGA
ncbi:MAG TPA: tetratricopeptide repeat protein [Terriglobia bacterium]|nr:tetratricopeptide repeat protein [Terriglobia bacterium]